MCIWCPWGPCWGGLCGTGAGRLTETCPQNSRQTRPLWKKTCDVRFCSTVLYSTVLLLYFIYVLSTSAVLYACTQYFIYVLSTSTVRYASAQYFCCTLFMYSVFCCTLFMYSVLLLYFMHVLSTLCMYTVLHA